MPSKTDQLLTAFLVQHKLVLSNYLLQFHCCHCLFNPLSIFKTLTFSSQVQGVNAIDVCIGNVNTDTGEKVNNYSINDFQVCSQNIWLSSLFV